MKLPKVHAHIDRDSVSAACGARLRGGFWLLIEHFDVLARSACCGHCLRRVNDARSAGETLGSERVKAETK